MQGQHRFLLILISGFSRKHKAAHPGLQGLTSKSLERDPGAPASHQPLGRVRIQKQNLRRRMIQLELLPLLQPWLQASMVLASLQRLKRFPPPVTSSLLGRCHSKLGLQAVAIATLAHQARPNLQLLAIASELGTSETIRLEIGVDRIQIRMARTAGKQPTLLLLEPQQRAVIATDDRLERRLVAELRPQQRTEPLTEGVGFIEGQ
jgi:hypothetical protein